MNFAAEFRRNLWLEFSPQRVIALPAIVLVLILLNQVGSNGDAEGLAVLGTWIFYLMVFLWGSRRAASAVSEEVNGGTWTGQRLSALSPAALVYGKLFGATAFVWFGGLLGLVLYVLGGLGAGEDATGMLVEVVQRLASAIFLHAMAIAVTLVLLNKRRLVGRLGTTLPQLLALGAALVLLGLFARLSIFSSVGLWQASTTWYGLVVDGPLFVALSAAVYALWALLGCLRLMAAQLQRQQLPWAWPLFTLFTMAFVQGLAQGEQLDVDFVGPLTAPFGVALVFFYLALFAERNEPLRYRQCLTAFGGGELRRGLGLLPWWVLGWPILLAVVLWRGAAAPLDPGLWGELAARVDMTTPQPLLANLGVALFALRDAAFVLWINSGRSQRGDLTAFIYLLVLYGPLMGLLGGMQAWGAMAVLAPLPLGSAAVSLLAVAAQIAVLGFLTLRRWRALFRT